MRIRTKNLHVTTSKLSISVSGMRLKGEPTPYNFAAHFLFLMIDL